MLTAPDVADLLAALTREELAELGAQTAATMPPGQRDQYLAAAAEVVRVLDGHGAVPAIPAELPDAVLVQIVHTLGEWHAGRLGMCIHHPQPDRPQPVLAAAWRPGRLACVACSHLLRLPRGSVADRTCDLCGRVCAGTDDDPIQGATANWGPLLFLFGVCQDCRPITTTERTAHDRLQHPHP